MTKIILFVIFLQVVFGILAKRKARRQAEEAARNPDAIPGEDIHPSERPALPASRRPSGWGGQSEDESDAEWDEHHSDENERSRPDPRNQLRRLPEESRRGERAEGRTGADGEGHDRDEHPARKGIDKGKAKELGKDLLSQLAKELGLEIPTDKPAPRPAPAPARPQPAAQTPPAKAKASATQAAKQSAASIKMAQSRAKDRQTEISRRGDESSSRRNDAGENTPRRVPGYLAVTPAAPMAVRVSASATARASLMDVKSLRNAFILKTILDKPLSLKPRGPGEV